MTGCECPFHGWCERHRVNKSTRMHDVCQTKQKYFDAWEQGRGPGQTIVQKPKSVVIGPGTVLARKLRLRGYTTLEGCGCKSKIAKMNAWGCDKCRSNLDEIVDWLEDAAKKRGWLERAVFSAPGIKTVGRLVIRDIVIEAIDLCDKIAVRRS